MSEVQVLSKLPALLHRFSGRTRTWGALRVLVYLACVNGVCGVIWARSAWADAERAAENVGLTLLQKLAPLSGAGGSVQPIVVNGERILFASLTTPLAPREVLDRFDQHCQVFGNGLRAEIGKLPRLAENALPDRLLDPARWAIWRDEADDGGVGQLGCIAQPDDGLRGLVARLGAFRDTGEVSKLGEARYVVARRSAEGNSTHVLALWPDGAFNLGAMVASDGDAPGSDSGHVPRPPDARRVLSATVPDQPYALRMYDSRRSRAELLDFYDREMQQRGWTARPVAPERGRGDRFVVQHSEWRSFTNGTVALLVATDALKDGEFGVTLIEMGSAGAAHTVATQP
jgi:hypothetical protein